jgi:DNA gyrase subunit A
MITDQGVIIQLRMEDIKVISRITSGVKMISLDEGVRVAKIAKVREKISDGDRDINMEDIDDVVINIAKSDEPVVVIHDEVDVDDDDEEDTRFDGVDDE